ncbi:MAG: hypothetical protein AAF600_06340 [Bacteroidota bacterium]
MSYKVDESKLMDYLYGELSDKEKKQMERYLQENETASAEFEALKEVQTVLGRVKDRETEVPHFTFPQPSVVVSDARLTPWWRYAMGLAASIALLFLMGYLTSLRISINDGGVQIAFGKNDSQSNQTYSKEDVENIVQRLLASNNEIIEEKLDQSEGAIIQKISQDKFLMNADTLNEYLAKLWNLDQETLMGIVENSEQHQKKYTDEMLRSLAIYLDVQRQNDLELIQARFENFENNAEYNQRQTNQILTNLIGTVAEQPINQYE